MKASAIINIILVAAVVSMFIYYNIRPCSCYVEHSVKSEDDALAFGKYWFARDSDFWKRVGISDSHELQAFLSKSSCCRAQRLSANEGEGRTWRVYIGKHRPGFETFDYEIFFDDCRGQIMLRTLG